MNRRELIKLFMASALPLGGLLDGLTDKTVDCRIEGWDVSFTRRNGCIQFFGTKEIRGEKCSYAMLFDNNTKIDTIKKIMRAQLKMLEKDITCRTDCPRKVFTGAKHDNVKS